MKPISVAVKRHCIELSKQGCTSRQIYDDYFNRIHTEQTYQSFRTSLQRWKRKKYCDDTTLNAGTYDGFYAHDATVQVNGQGEVIQAWIKQKSDEEAYNKLIEAIQTNYKPIKIEKVSNDTAEKRMLEIGLYDMHFGLNNDYSNVYSELCEITSQHKYEEINLIIGQDMLHNDDFRGRTSKGTQIEKIDVVKAWNDARDFWTNLICHALSHCDNINLIYVKGNHDESLCWAFVQMLKAIFPALNVDDSLKKRKCISWNGCFVGLTHGNEAKSSPNDLRGQFTIAFSEEFAKSKVREIHCGHLHHEKESDVYGVMVRRLSTANTTDEWSENEGFIGSHKRFMVFEYVPNRLKSIFYVGG